MRKFTIFTVILSVVVTVVAVQIFAESYLPSSSVTNSKETKDFNLPTSLDLSKATETNIFGSGINYQEVSLGDEQPQTVAQNTPTPPVESGDANDFEDESYKSPSLNIDLRDDQVQSAGFIDATVKSEAGNGFLFKTIYVDDLYDVTMEKSSVENASTSLAKAYIFRIGPTSSVDDVYEILKVRGSQGLEVELNETNSFGDGSFYINDSRRQNVAFLTTKIGNIIYSFSYPKEYHQQISNLIKLIGMEFK